MSETLRPETPEIGDDTTPVLTLIKQIREKRLDPRVLSAEDRRRCVTVLSGEGYSAAEIGQILERGERTIFRDLAAVRAANALKVTPHFPLQMAGEMCRQAEVSISRLRRIAREPAASAMERLMAESAAWRVLYDMMTKLQSLGYLPRVPTGVVAQVIDHGNAGPIPSFDEMAQRLQALERVDRETGISDTEQSEQRRLLMDMVERGRLSVQIEKLDRQRPNEG